MNTADTEMLEILQRETFSYFADEADHATGLVTDRTEPGSPASIAAVGLALTAYPVAVEHGWWTRPQAIERVLTTLRFFQRSEQGRGKHASGYRGFYYHFLDMKSGARTGTCELSTIDTAILIAGALAASQYFDRDTKLEREIRRLADELYRRVEWTWLATHDGTLRHGWTPEHGFLPTQWDTGYSEAHILYVLALGSPTFPVAEDGYREWTASFEARTLYQHEVLYAGPLFIHQLSQLWLDLRGVSDALTRSTGFDYAENSRRATLIQRAYAIDNPHGFAGYSERAWGVTASDGPGPAVQTIDGISRTLLGYAARGVPLGPDDGTLSPWAIVASIPFAPEIVCDATRYAIDRLALKNRSGPGFAASYNPTIPGRDGHAWISPWEFGLNQGPILVAIENFKTELTWRSMRSCRYVIDGLERAGFVGGWLDTTPM